MTANPDGAAGAAGPPRVLVAGIGNIFLGDDAFGVEVAQRLLHRPAPPGVRVVDFGIRGIDLAYALADGWDAAVLVDAVPRGGAPGTLYVIEPQVAPGAGPAGASFAAEAHAMDPAKVLAAVATMGGGPRKVLLVGCEPAPPGNADDADDADDMRFGLSDRVRAAVDPAVALVESLVGRLLAGQEPLAQADAPA